METIPITGARDFEDSPFPVTPVWDGPASPWHASYPQGIPPSIKFTPRRVERLLEAAVERYPDRIALRYFRTSCTFSELLGRIRQTAGALRELGVESGDRVMLVLPNSPEFVITWFAVHWLGAEVVPANPLMSGAELSQLARKCNVQVAFGLDVRLEPVVEMADELRLKALIVTSLAPHLPLAFSVPYRMRQFFSRWEAKCRNRSLMIRRSRPFCSRPAARPGHRKSPC